MEEEGENLALDEKELQMFFDQDLKNNIWIFCTKEQICQISTRGFVLVVSDPNLKKKFIGASDVLMVPPENTVSIAARLILTERSQYYSNWFELTSTCPKLPEEIESDADKRGRYMKESCGYSYLSYIMKIHCGCQPLLLQHGKPMENNTVICGPEVMLNCFVPSLSVNNASTVDEICHAPCYDYSYRIEKSYAGLTGFNSSQPMSRVLFRYLNDEYIFNEYKRFTVSTFFSQIGGALGLTLGASLITMVEFFILVIKGLWYAITPNRRRNKVLAKKEQTHEIPYGYLTNGYYTHT